MGVLTFAALSYVLRTVYRRLDRLGIFDTKLNEAHHDTAWVNSLHGLAALGVLTSHLTLILAPSMTEACCSSPSSTTPSLLQLPPLRLLAAAQSHLSLFLILSGFTSSLTPLHLSRTNNLPSAYRHLSHSALTRPLRFLLPASTVTILSWLLTQLHIYIPARAANRFLLSTNSPLPSPTWVAALRDLIYALLGTWNWGNPTNAFEPMQWALVWMLQGSYLIYLVSLITIPLFSARSRITVILLVLALSWSWHLRLVDPFVGPAYLSGMLLNEFWYSLRGQRQRFAAMSRWATPALIGVAVVLMSWAKNRAEDVFWTRAIRALLVAPLPRVLDPERLVGTIGSVLLILAVMISPKAQAALAHPFLLWLGRISFAIYLLHMVVIRAVMPWLVFVGNPAKALWLLGSGADVGAYSDVMVGEPGLFRRMVGTVVLILVILTAAHQWMRRVEPILHKAARGIEEFVTGESRINRETRQREAGNGVENGGLPKYQRSKAVQE